MVKVELDNHDAVLCAAYAAEMCFHTRQARGWKHHGGSSSRPFGRIFGDYVLGQLAEKALSRHFGMRFEPPVLGDYKSADLGGLCEVKAADHPRSGLPVYKSQFHDAKLMSFVRMEKFTAHLMGWIFGRDAKEVWTWEPTWDTPCYRVDPKYLNPIETMPMDGRKFTREWK